MLPIAVESRLIRSLFFDPKTGCLRMRMANGEERAFVDVTAEAVTELVEATSPGRHYMAKFRHRHRRAA